MLAARLMLLSAVVIWGCTFVATKICLQSFNPAELLGARLIIALPILYLLARLTKAPLTVEKAQIRPILIGSAIITAHFLIQITGMITTTATNTGWLISITPLVMAVLSALILKEKITRFAMVGIAVATIGVLLLISRGDFGSIGWLKSTGDWLVLVSAHTWALYTIATRDLSRSGHPLTITFYILLPCGLAMFGYMLLLSDFGRLLAAPTEVLVSLVFLAVLGTAIGHWFWQVGLSKMGAARAGYFLYLEPLSTTALAVPYLGEPFGIFTIIGGLMVLGGVFIADRGKSA